MVLKPQFGINVGRLEKLTPDCENRKEPPTSNSVTINHFDLIIKTADIDFVIRKKYDFACLSIVKYSRIE